MARTLDRAAHALKREAYADAALRLIQTKGYEQMSVQDVLDDLGASRGAFYHYFDSKAALLEAAIERMTDLAIDSLEAGVKESELPALEQLRRFFSGIARWKGERPGLIREVLRVWISDQNALVREKFRRHATLRMVPVLAPILRQANQEGTTSTGPVEGVAAVTLGLMLAANDTACHLYVARQENTISFEEVERTLTAYYRAFERILGLPPGSLPGLEPETLRFWFG